MLWKKKNSKIKRGIKFKLSTVTISPQQPMSAINCKLTFWKVKINGLVVKDLIHMRKYLKFEYLICLWVCFLMSVSLLSLLFCLFKNTPLICFILPCVHNIYIPAVICFLWFWTFNMLVFPVRCEKCYGQLTLFTYENHCYCRYTLWTTLVYIRWLKLPLTLFNLST